MTGWIDALYRRILLAAHPVGSIYQSTDATSPAKLFGGTWTAIESRFLLAASSDYPAGSTGGEATHTLTENELPEHAHLLPAKRYMVCWGEAALEFSMIVSTPTWGTASSYTTDQWGVSGADVPNQMAADQKIDQTQSSGGGQPYTTMPPYMAVYMWRRTA